MAHGMAAEPSTASRGRKGLTNRQLGVRFPWAAWRGVLRHRVAAIAAILVLVLFGVLAVNEPSGGRESEVVVSALAVIGVASACYLVLKGRWERAPGYLWSIPLVAAVLGLIVICWQAQDDERWLLVVAALLVLAAAALRILYSSITPAWGAGLAIAGTLAFLFALADHLDLEVLTDLLILGTPLVAAGLVVANTSRRTALGALLILPLVSLLWLGRLGASELRQTCADGRDEACEAVEGAADATVTECPTPGAPERSCIDASYVDLVRFGWRTVFVSLTDDRSLLITPPVGDLALLVAPVVYLYLASRLLRFNTQRLRSVVDVEVSSQTGPAAGVRATADHTFLHVVLSGPVVLGEPSTRGQDRSGGVIQAVVRSTEALGWWGTIARSFRAEPPVRAYLSRRAQRCDLMIEDGVTGRTVCAPSFTAPQSDGPVEWSREEQAGYTVLAYCLAARGMPAWASWNIDGKGLRRWAAARRMRRERWGGGSSECDAEIQVLEAAVDREPRALLLTLELASRYHEQGRYDQALAQYLRALLQYPQFPECWVRVAAACVRLGSAVEDGRLVAIEPAAQDQLLSVELVEMAACVPGFGELARDLEEHLIRSTSRSGGSGDPLGAPEFIAHEHIGNVEKALLRICRQPLRSEQAAMLARFLRFAAVGAAVKGRRRTNRFVLLARTLLIQSERTFFWNLLFSRYHVRRIAVALRAIELLGRQALDPHDPKVQSMAEATGIAMEREGTGWRAPLYLAEYYRNLEAARTRSSVDASRFTSEADLAASLLADGAGVLEAEERCALVGAAASAEARAAHERRRAEHGWQTASRPFLRRVATALWLRSFHLGMPAVRDRVRFYAQFGLTSSRNELGAEPWCVDQEFRFAESLDWLGTSKNAGG